MESRTRQKKKTKFLVSTRLLLIQFRICIVSSVLSKIWIWAAQERSPGKQVLAVVHGSFLMIPKNVAGSGPVFDEARVRKLFGDRNRGCYTEACVVPHTLEWNGSLAADLQKAFVLQCES